MPDPDCIVEFHHSGRLPLDAPMPAPMDQVLPGWLRAMPAAVDETARQAHDRSPLTLRACAPLMEAMGLGYALLWPMRLRIDVVGREANGDYDLRVDPAMPALLESHPPRQAPGMPGAGLPILKLMNPWIVRTPPGTSCLIAPLFNQPERTIIPFAAMVETDRYFTPIHLPFMLAVPVGGSVVVERGEPFAQLIPMRRDNWQAARGDGDARAQAETRRILDENRPGAYAKMLRVRRRFR